MDFDVVIVGLGPIGAVAANLASTWGLKTLAAEKSLEIYDKPRAIGMDHEVMRVFENIGIADKIADVVTPYRTAEYHTSGARVLKRIAPAPPPYVLGWAPSYVFNQPAVERVLRENLSTKTNVEVRLGTDVVSVTQEGGISTVLLKDASGSEYQVTTRFVLACDGGTSPLRVGLGLEMEDLVFDEPWMVVDIMVGPEAAERLPQTNVQYCEPARPCTYIVGPGAHRRWEFMINPDETPASIQTPESIRNLLSRWLAPHEYELWRASAYRFHALVLKRWRDGNMFFLGDAAHMTPPFMAQGMCQGVRDASNLIWKLATVQRGLAADSLLDTYQDERVPHVRQTTLVTKELGMVICERDASKAAKRDEILLAEMAKSKGPTIRQSLIPGLTSGMISPVGTPSVRGVLFPQPLVENGAGLTALLDDFTGAQFRVVATDTCDLAPLEAELRTWNEDLRDMIKLVCVVSDETTPLVAALHVREKENVLRHWTEKHACRILIVRPDHYIYGGANDTTDAIAVLRSLKEKFSENVMQQKAA